MAADGAFVARIYGPKPDAIDGKWKLPPFAVQELAPFDAEAETARENREEHLGRE